MRLIAKVYEEDGIAHVVHYVPVDNGVTDLMHEAWRRTHGEVVKLDVERVEKARSEEE